MSGLNFKLVLTQKIIFWSRTVNNNSVEASEVPVSHEESKSSKLHGTHCNMLTDEEMTQHINSKWKSLMSFLIGVGKNWRLEIQRPLILHLCKLKLINWCFYNRRCWGWQVTFNEDYKYISYKNIFWLLKCTR